MSLFRLLFTTAMILLLFSCKDPLPRPIVRLIPLPAQVSEHEGVFLVNSSTRIQISHEREELRRIAGFLSSHIGNYFGITSPIVNQNTSVEHPISLKIDDQLKLGKEDYHLVISPDGVLIEATNPQGLFYGVQTLIQLMPPAPKKLVDLILPAIEIRDTPRFAWRGIQLDVSRHFMPKAFILKYLDMLAQHKLNTFQWHLSDDQGWRIEIKKYPRLTEIGSVRKKTIIGHIKNSAGLDTVSNFGFYSQNDVREIVAYAAERYITIIPEIGMPGHALAALAAYPELGCTAAPYEVATRWGIFSDTFCPGKEETFTFLNDVITEMSAIFPGKYFHIDGAECPESVWEKCPQCQLRIKNDTLSSIKNLHDYFVRRVSKMLEPLGKERVGWDDILDDTLVRKGVVIAWHGENGAIAAAKNKTRTVIASAKYCNFDQFQSVPENEPLAVGGLLTLEQVYNFEPIPAALSRQEARYIIGVQANVWTPYMKTPVYVEYMTFPRAAAMAEVVWSPKASRNYLWFKKRLLMQLKRYDAEGLTYCKAEFKTATY